MRRGDFGVEVIPSGREQVRELETGHVMARPDTIYRLRLRNFGPLHCVANIRIDGRPITAGGLVLRPFSVTELERPVDDGEDGRFTVAAEGNEVAFGPDGGRDNEALGLIDASFRRELPTGLPDAGRISFIPAPSSISFQDSPPRRPRFDALLGAPSVDIERSGTRSFERAAGTALTGHSDQQFVPMSLGPLEPEATVIQLRIVIASEADIANAPAPREETAPARPAARP